MSVHRKRIRLRTPRLAFDTSDLPSPTGAPRPRGRPFRPVRATCARRGSDVSVCALMIDAPRMNRPLNAAEVCRVLGAAGRLRQGGSAVLSRRWLTTPGPTRPRPPGRGVLALCVIVARDPRAIGARWEGSGQRAKPTGRRRVGPAKAPMARRHRRGHDGRRVHQLSELRRVTCDGCATGVTIR
jgi:hypothetical protein